MFGTLKLFCTEMRNIRHFGQSYPSVLGEITVFIALIHPIQWTIAYPVGADRPAKRQKKTSCVSTGQAGPVLCTRQVACSTSFLSRQRDVIASFSFGACLCARNIFIRSLSSVFIVFGENWTLYLCLLYLGSI